LVVVTTLIILCCILNSSHIAGQEMFVSSKLKIDISNTIQAESPVDVQLYYFPFNTTSQQVDFVTEPSSELKSNYLLFNFNEPGNLNFNVYANVQSWFNFIDIKDNVSVQQAIQDESFPEYRESTEYIDSDNLFILNKAEQFKEKTNNSLELLHMMAEYVRENMHYSLSYSQPQKASWILENKVGVCSHYTTLFLALARSLGFQGRYVSGIAYSEDDKTFQEHAWAEIYIPNYGWISYDVTFGQYGWVDSNHVILKYSKDTAEASVEYEYSGNLEPGDLQINSNLEEKGNPYYLPFKINIKVYKDNVKLGSYVPLIVEIENNNDFYFSLPIYLTTAPGVYGKTIQVVFLKPNEKSSAFFVLQIPKMEKCRDGCIGNITVKDAFGNSDSSSIKFSNTDPEMSLKEAQTVIENGNADGNFDFFCSSDKNFYYENEVEHITCMAYATVANDFEICLNNCTEFNQETNATISFQLKPNSLICPRLVKENKTVVSACVNVEVIKKPIVEIAKIIAKDTTHGDLVNVSINFSSNANLDGLAIVRDSKNRIVGEFRINIKRGKNVLIVILDSAKLHSGINHLKLYIAYGLDNPPWDGSTEKNFDVYVKRVNFFKEIYLKLKSLII